MIVLSALNSLCTAVLAVASLARPLYQHIVLLCCCVFAVKCAYLSALALDGALWHTWQCSAGRMLCRIMVFYRCACTYSTHAWGGGHTGVVLWEGCAYLGCSAHVMRWTCEWYGGMLLLRCTHNIGINGVKGRTATCSGVNCNAGVVWHSCVCGATHLQQVLYNHLY